MLDRIENIGKSVIQHGKQNDRVYLMKLAPDDMPGIIDHLEDIVRINGYTKFFAKIEESLAEPFFDRGFITEAKIPYFYKGTATALFLSKYFDKTRAVSDITTSEAIKNNLEIALKKSNSKSGKKLQDIFEIRKLDFADCEKLAGLYKKVFATYPFPIDDPLYLSKTMKEHIVYFGIFKDDTLISASSCETDAQQKNVEMTDFATHPDYRGFGFGIILLREMELYMRKNSYLCSYTIARAMSPAMNITFAKLGYKFAGTLINNTNISGNIESMNVWYKSLL